MCSQSGVDMIYLMHLTKKQWAIKGNRYESVMY